jgi:hypothetical protein
MGDDKFCCFTSGRFVSAAGRKSARLSVWKTDSNAAVTEIPITVILFL